MNALSAPATIDRSAIAMLLQAARAIDPELQEIFAEEAEDHLRTIYDGLDRLRVDGSDRVALGDIRRAAHTLKGAAGAVGVQSVTRLAHRMEDLLDDLFEENKTAGDEITLLLLSTADRMQELTGDSIDVDLMVDAIADLYTRYDAVLPAGAGDSATAKPAGTAEAPKSLVSLTHGLSREDHDEESEPTDRSAIAPSTAAQATAKPAAAETHIRVPLSRLDEMTRLVGEMIINRSAFAQRLGDFTTQIDDLQTALTRLRGVTSEVETQYSVQALRGDSSGAAPLLAINPNRVDEFDELEFDRYTEFHLMARTLSEATGDVGSIASECRVLSGDFDALLGRWQRLTRDAQDRLMQIRMVPLRSIVAKLGRVARSTASQVGKNVRLVVRGDHTELDKTVLEEIADPLLHLIRNAIDHGIESPQARVAAGKPREATLLIEAINQGTQLTLRVEDDGRGLDLNRIRQRAIERGLISENQAVSTEQLQMMIFAPGFSTAQKITDVSGRGVGMDVVRDTVQRLKGTIRVDSTPGSGARFMIILPTTLAVTRALVIQSAGSTFAIPMQAITKIARLDPAAVSRIGDDVMVDMEGRTLRLTEMGQQLDLSPACQFDRPLPMLIIESGDRRVAVCVDQIDGGQDIVVKSLGDHLRCVPGLIGSTIRGDGSVIPILDPADLVGLLRHMPMAAIPSGSGGSALPGGSKHRRNVMIVDDSVSVRRITASVMRSDGWSVATAKDGVDALEALTAEDTVPNVILLDMEMPRMDGLELLANLRATDRFRHIPVVMVTSRAGEKHRRRAMDAGATEYLVKPFRDDNLIDIATRLADGVTA